MPTKQNQYLVIVESPAKSKTIGKILGTDYIIESSIGHIRDLPGRKTGVNTRKKFEPTYEIMPGKQKVVDKLIKLASKVNKIYLATDPDREGEAIAWHLSEILSEHNTNIARVTFNEITQKAVKSAFDTPGELILPKVNAQQARRILDRLVGYKVSPLIRRKIGGKSAGRVQSVAVRLICDRESEVEAFKTEEYWTFDGNGIPKSAAKSNLKLDLNLISWQNKRIVHPDKLTNEDKYIWIKSEAEAKEVTNAFVLPSQLLVNSVKEREVSRKPGLPFITSSLQRSAASTYGFGVKKTMQIAQQLYEGIDLYKDGNPIGLITYMRTDSTRISEEAKQDAEEYINTIFGNEYSNIQKKSKSKKGAQDAHEAIRPSYVVKTPVNLKQVLTSDQYKLYKLIWERFVASQMQPARYKRITVDMQDQAKRGVFRTSAQELIFAGYTKVWEINSFDDTNNNEVEGEDPEEKFVGIKLPDIKKGDIINLNDLKSKQHFTEPPARFNEASLVKTLEELGIGRPSTYAATIFTIIDREYVLKTESKTLAPTPLGKEVNQVLSEHFADIINTKFTALMETQLDKVEKEELEWRDMLHEFYEPFKKVLKNAQEQIVAHSEPTDHKCTECGEPMVKKNSFYGPFLACSQYPECKAIQKLTKDGELVPPPRESKVDCPKCTTKLMITYGRFGDYLKCPNEECKHQMPIIKSMGLSCPKDNCAGEIIEKKSRFGKIFYGCTEYSNTKCDQVFWNNPINEQCPDCDSLLTYKHLKRGDKIACPIKECGYTRLAIESDKDKLYKHIPEEE